MKRASSTINIQTAQIKNSEEKVFQNLFESLWSPMYTYAFSLLEDGDLAQDMVQEVWIDFWERRKTIENTNLKGYLYKAVRYRVLKELRDSKLKPTDLEILDTLYVEASTEETPLNPEDTKVLLENTLSILPQKCKEVFKLSKLQGLKNKEIAKELGISENTVENHISKALKLLKTAKAFLFSLFVTLLLLIVKLM